MGLFDGKSNIPTTVLGMAQGFGDNLGRAALDPIMENFGYESEESRILEIVKGADMSSPESFTKTFQALLEISPEAASEFKTQGMALLEAHLKKEKIDADRASKRKTERKIIKDAQDRQRYVDTGELVFPNVKGKTEEDTKPSDLPQMTAQTKDQIGSLVDEVFDFSVWDLTGQNTDISKVAMTDFVFSYSQIKNIPATEVIRGLVNGTIQYTSNIGNANSGTTTTSPFNVPAQPK